jgi:pimeloyl-ACP methyl ester carboxylesterase
MYIVHFQRPGEADAVLAADVERTMSFFMRRPLPGQGPASGGLSSPSAETDVPRQGASAFALIKMLETWAPEFDPRPPLLEPAEMAFFVQSFKRTGFTGGINWYRNFTRNWAASANIADRIDVPSLMVMAEKDAVLPPSAADGMTDYVHDLEKRLIRDSGHWTQQEKPDEVNRVIIDWMARRFPT